MNEEPEVIEVYAAGCFDSQLGKRVPLIDRTGPEPRVIGEARVVSVDEHGNMTVDVATWGEATITINSPLVVDR